MWKLFPKPTFPKKWVTFALYKLVSSIMIFEWIIHFTKEALSLSLYPDGLYSISVCLWGLSCSISLWDSLGHVSWCLRRFLQKFSTGFASEIIFYVEHQVTFQHGTKSSYCTKVKINILIWTAQNQHYAKLWTWHRIKSKMDKVRVNIFGPKLSIYKKSLFGVLWLNEMTVWFCVCSR